MNNNIITIYLAVSINGSYKKIASQRISQRLATAVECDHDYCYRWAEIEGYTDVSAMIQR